MLEHGRELLRAVGYGSAEGPFVEMGVGIDFGEAFVGNIGERRALRLHRRRRRRQHGLPPAGRGRGGEIVISERVAEGLPARLGARVELDPQGEGGASGRLPRHYGSGSQSQAFWDGEALLVEVAAELVELGRLDAVDVVGLGEVA